MVEFAIKRFPWTLTLEQIIDGFKRLPMLNDYSEIRCLKGKYWEFVVEDLMELIPKLEGMVGRIRNEYVQVGKCATFSLLP